MARQSSNVLIAGMIMFTASGCGTVCNLAGAVIPYGDNVPRPAIYGGVQTDLAFYDRQLNPKGSNWPPASAKEGEGAVFMVALAYADFPLSLIGDTLTLPIALWVNSRSAPREEQIISSKESARRVPGPSSAYPISEPAERTEVRTPCPLITSSP